MKRGTLLDRAIGTISPAWGVKRLRSRYALSVLRDHLDQRGGSLGFEAGTRGRRTDGWRTTSSGVNAQLSGQLGLLRERSRDLCTNNGWASKAVRSIVANTVGTGIMPKHRGLPDAQLDEARRLWELHAESTSIDPEGRLDIYGIQAQALREAVRAGEVLIRRRWRRDEDGLPLPVQFQLIPPDHLDTSKNERRGLNRIVNGVEYDAIGRREAYWLFPEHPGEIDSITYSSVRVDAIDVQHVFRPEEIGQSRGIPWGTPILLRSRDLDEYEDAQLLRQKMAACFVAFVFHPNPDEAAGAVAGTGPLRKTADTGETIEEIAPGIVEYLEPGQDVRFGNPPAVEGYPEYLQAGLRAVAAGFGVTYEALTGDYANVNFSSGRMGWLEMGREIDQWQWLTLIPQLCQPLHRWFFEAALVAGKIEDLPTASWTTPKRDMISPEREVPATIKAIRAGITTRSEVIRSQGWDPAEVMDELEADARDLDQRGLLLESDLRHTKGQKAPK